MSETTTTRPTGMTDEAWAELQAIDRRRGKREGTLFQLARFQSQMLLADVRDLVRRSHLLELARAAAEDADAWSPQLVLLDGPLMGKASCVLADARLDQFQQAHAVDDVQAHPPDDADLDAGDAYLEHVLRSDPSAAERAVHDAEDAQVDVIAQRNAEDASQPQKEFSDCY